MSVQSYTQTRPPIRCFISYAHEDDAGLNFVDGFKSSLAQFTYANSGRQLEIFVDHDGIGWGEDWRERIRDSIQTALVFIPLFTLRYLDRPMCREELNLFVDSAKKLGVAELFLPVVVLGHDQITENSADPVVRLIAQRQFKDLRQAVIDGPGSSTWRATLLDLSESLVAAVDNAEARLESLQTDLQSQVEGKPSVTGSVATQDGPGLIELMESIGNSSEHLIVLVNRFVELMASFQATAVPITSQLSGADANQGRQLLTHLADSVQGIADEMESVGTEMETVTTRADGDLRRAWILAVESGQDSLKETLRTVVLGPDGDNFAGIGDVVSTMTAVLDQMKGVEVISVSLRTAMRPLRQGVTSVRSAILTVEAWPKILSES